jgi:hypothetical protein
VATVPGPSGYDELYLVVERDGVAPGDKQYFLEILRDDGEVYLDSFRPYAGPADADGYGDGAVVYDPVTGKTYPASPPPIVTGFIGYPYKSVMRSMPILANNQMKKQRITTLVFRFLRSFLPKVTSIAGGKTIKTDAITNLSEPFTGVWEIAFPGTWDEDVRFELTHDQPTPVTLLALNAEAQ